MVHKEIWIKTTKSQTGYRIYECHIKFQNRLIAILQLEDITSSQLEGLNCGNIGLHGNTESDDNEQMVEFQNSEVLQQIVI